MPRTVKPAEVRKLELTDVALGQFVRHGYEKTSVRGILEEAHGTIGMFYHHFRSKREIFEAAIERSNDLFYESIREIMQNVQKPLMQRLTELFSLLPMRMRTETLMTDHEHDGDALLAMRRHMLVRMVPVVAEVMEEAASLGMLTLPEGQDALLVAHFVVHGCDALHHMPDMPPPRIMRATKALVGTLLRVDPKLLVLQDGLPGACCPLP